MKFFIFLIFLLLFVFFGTTSYASGSIDTKCWLTSAVDQWLVFKKVRQRCIYNGTAAVIPERIRFKQTAIARIQFSEYDTSSGTCSKSANYVIYNVSNLSGKVLFAVTCDSSAGITIVPRAVCARHYFFKKLEDQPFALTLLPPDNAADRCSD